MRQVICEKFPVADILDLITEIGFSRRGFEGRLELLTYMAQREIRMHEVLRVSMKCKKSLMEQSMHLRSSGVQCAMDVLHRNLRDADAGDDPDAFVQDALEKIKGYWGEKWMVYPLYVAPHKIRATK